MLTDSIVDRIENAVVPNLERLPVVSIYAKSRGWPYIIAWLHRITGIFIVLFLLFHLYTLSFLETPEVYDAKMRFFRIFVFIFLEWALAVPVIFHALNGGRLILFEVFGTRKDDLLIRWLWALSLLYVLLLGGMMLPDNQSVTPGFFWVTTLLVALCVGVAVGSKLRTAGTSRAFKLQRISGGLLLIMIPAHMLFMHLNASTGHVAQVVIARMGSVFIKGIDVVLVVTALYHGGYGLVSIVKDYVRAKSLQTTIAVLLAGVMMLFAWMGIKLIIRI